MFSLVGDINRKGKECQRVHGFKREMIWKGNPSEGVKKLGESVEQRYLQSFRIAAFDRHRSQGSASEREWFKFFTVSSCRWKGTALKLFQYPPSPSVRIDFFTPSQLRGMDSADPPGISSKILSSGCFKIFIGKGNYRYHKLFLVLFRGFCGLRDKLTLLFH